MINPIAKIPSDHLKSRASLLWMRIAVCGVLSLLLTAAGLSAQTTSTWEQIKDRFKAGNPTLKAAQAAIDESRANETTAYLRPNPVLTGTIDQIDPFTKQPSLSGSGQDVYRPFANALPFASISYLHEREHKRELRRDSAMESTAIAQSNYSDQERNLLFMLRNAFVQVLQAKAVLQNTVEQR